MATPSASRRAPSRLRYANAVGMFSRIAAAIAETGGDIGAIDIVAVAGPRMVRDAIVTRPTAATPRASSRHSGACRESPW